MPTTDESEAGTVRDIQAVFADDQQTYKALLARCEGDEFEPGNDFQVCARREAYPFQKSSVSTAADGLRELIPEVGAECRRVLRAAATGISRPLRGPTKLLREAVAVCRDESGQ